MFKHSYHHAPGTLTKNGYIASPDTSEANHLKILDHFRTKISFEVFAKTKEEKRKLKKVAFKGI